MLFPGQGGGDDHQQQRVLRRAPRWVQRERATVPLAARAPFSHPLLPPRPPRPPSRPPPQLNDGFGGGHDIHSNLLFQTCGESGDHGAVNTWDRQAFVTTVRDGTPSIVPAETAIHHNFIVSDYDANGGMIDNDDGSSFYDEYSNFGVYGGAKFANIDGHGKKSHGNVYAFPNVYSKSCFWHWPGWFPLAGYEEVFFNNTCIMDGAQQNYIMMPDSQCSFANASVAVSTVHLVAHDNKVFAPSAEAVVNGCGTTALPFADWMKLGVDHGSTLAPLPTNDEIVAMGMAVLGL